MINQIVGACFAIYLAANLAGSVESRTFSLVLHGISILFIGLVYWMLKEFERDKNSP